MSRSASYYGDLNATVLHDIHERAAYETARAAFFADQEDLPRWGLHALQASFWTRLAPAAEGWRYPDRGEEFVLAWVRKQVAPKLTKTARSAA